MKDWKSLAGDGCIECGWDKSAIRNPQSAISQSAICNLQTAIFLPAPWCRLIHFDTLDSTQTEAARRLGAGESLDGVVIRAERQSAGRGRLDHGWVSEAGGLYVTAGLPYDLPLQATDLGWIALLAAEAAAATLRMDWGFDAAVKWPNDLIVQGRKVGGLLGEVKSLPGNRRQILIGLGLNWTNRIGAASLPDPEGASAPPGALAGFRPGLPPEGRDGFLAGWLDRLNCWHERLLQDYNLGLGMLRRRMEAILWRKNELVTLQHTECGPVQGRLLGLGTGGAARLELAPGHLTEVHCGWQIETETATTHNAQA